MADPLFEQAFSPGNPAIVMLRRLRADPELRVAKRIGSTVELDEASFYEVAAKLERPKGTS